MIRKKQDAYEAVQQAYGFLKAVWRPWPASVCSSLVQIYRTFEEVRICAL